MAQNEQDRHLSGLSRQEIVSSAQQLLDNRLFRYILESMRDIAIQQWRQTGMMQAEERERLFLRVHALDALSGAVLSYVEAARENPDEKLPEVV